MYDDTELVCSRIFHDLASPLSAVSAGLELIELAGSTTPEHDLLAESAEQSLARLKFFKWAFGASGKSTVKTADVIDIISKCFRYLTLSGLPTPLTEQEVKFVCLIAGLCNETSHGTETIHFQVSNDQLVTELPFQLPLPRDLPDSAYLKVLDTSFSSSLASAAYTETKTTLRLQPDPF